MGLPGPCPSQLWDGPTIWQFDEPYRDEDDSGEYDFGESYCDSNLNGRYDGIWVVGGVNHHADSALDDIFVRTSTISDGTKTVAIASVDALGLFDTDVNVARDLVAQAHPEVELFVSADHNESSPDTVGLWGPSREEVPSDVPAGASSGVNDYYMTFLADRIAESVDRAIAGAHTANIRIVETTAPGIVPNFKQWPTSNRKDGSDAVPSPQQAGRIDTWNPKVHIMQAKDSTSEATIFTLVGYDAHVQNLGHSDQFQNMISADWPGFFWPLIEGAQGGVAIYMQGANGSVETPQVPGRGSPPEGSLERSIAIAEELADVTNQALSGTNPGAALAFGPVKGQHDTAIRLPVQNNLFTAAFAAHLFPHKEFSDPPADPDELAMGGDRPWISSSVGVARIGTLELIANPGESFPALIRGSHWGQDESCGSRANPPVPVYFSNAQYRWDIGLADDMVGYNIPAWGWHSFSPTYSRPDDECSLSEDDGKDAKGHQHALETESLGPAAGNIIATHLVDLIQEVGGASNNDVLRGRYLFADGTVSRRPYVAPFDPDGVVEPTKHAVGVVVSTSNGFKTYALASFKGPYDIAARGSFIDFDGRTQAATDQTTRGMSIASKQTYLDVWPDLTPAPKPSPSPSPTPTPGGSPSPSPSASASPTASTSPTPTSSPTASPSATPKPSPTPGQPGSKVVTSSIKAKPRRVHYKRLFGLSGRVTATGDCGDSYLVDIRRTVAGQSEAETIATVLTQQDGTWHFESRSKYSAEYSALPTGAADCEGDASSAAKVGVHAKISLSASSCGAEIKGRVAPRYPGTRVDLQRKKGRRFRTIDKTKTDGRSRFGGLVADCAGDFRLRWRSRSPGNLSTIKRLH
jgi:hypothetical protein